MDLATFRARWPEFAFAPDTYVTAYLAAALVRLDVNVWGTLLAEGQGWLAAHEMAITPAGQANGLATKDGRSSYGTKYDRLVRVVAGGAWLL